MSGRRATAVLPAAAAGQGTTIGMIASLGILCCGNGLLTTAVGLAVAPGRLDPAAARPVLTGYPLGFLLGCLLARPLIARFGHVGALLLVIALSAAASLTLEGGLSVPIWAAVRVANGIAIACGFAVAESWINIVAGASNRGRLISAYMVANSIGLALGQAMINLDGRLGGHLYLLAAAIMAVAAAPFAARRAPARPAAGPEARHPPVSFARFFRIAPLAILAALQCGMTNVNFLVVGPVYGAMLGFGPGEVGAIVMAFSIGGLIGQPLVGWLSDRMERRLVLAGLTLASTLLCLVLAFGGVTTLPALLALLLLYGTFTLSIYPVALAIALSKVEAEAVVAVSGKFLLVYAAGSVVAPTLTTAIMDSVAPPFLFALLGALAALVFIAAILSLARARSA